LIQVGELAPDFTLDSTDGSFMLSSFRGNKNVAMIFYPKDNTPGCNRQLSAARDALEQYAVLDTQVIAVNPGSLESHKTWCAEFGFGFPVLVDEERKVASVYGALKPEGSIQRCVILVNKQGIVAWAKEGLPETTEIIEAITTHFKSQY
jgi:thioredoxin-dependent peroxiredoxin